MKKTLNNAYNFFVFLIKICEIYEILVVSDHSFKL
jgi:hypothetical protein